MSNEIKAVEVATEEIERTYGVAAASLSRLVEAARDCEAIAATLSAHYTGESPYDHILIPQGVMNVVERFIYVICEYRNKVFALEAERDLLCRRVGEGSTQVDELKKSLGLAREHAHKIATERDISIQERQEIVTAMSKTIELRNAKISDLEAKLATERKSNETIERAREAISKERDAARHDYEQLASAIDQANDDDRGAADELARMTEARDLLAERCGELRQMITHLEEQIAGSQKTESADTIEIPGTSETPSEQLAKLTARITKYRGLVEAVGRKISDVPPSVRAAHQNAVSH